MARFRPREGVGFTLDLSIEPGDPAEPDAEEELEVFLTIHFVVDGRLEHFFFTPHSLRKEKFRSGQLQLDPL